MISLLSIDLVPKTFDTHHISGIPVAIFQELKRIVFDKKYPQSKPLLLLRVGDVQ